MLPVLLVLAAALPAQGITLLEGPDRANLSVRILDEQNPALPGQLILQNVELLPIEIAGRTALQELETERARRIERHGWFRVELPFGGRLFGYRRLGGRFWGFLLVPRDGRAQVVLEEPGQGPAGTTNPFADRIGIAADGRHAAVPLLAGGLLIVRLDGGVFASTGTAARAVATAAPVDEISTMLGPRHLFFLTEDERLWRCPLADGGAPADVSPPAVPQGFFKTELAMSGDGSAVVCIHGPRDQQTLWLVRETGGPAQLPPGPSKYEEPDYLPEGTGHPHLLLNGDATRLLYVEGQSRDELFLLDVPAATPPLHLTGDALFQPYIGGHILPRFVGTALFVAIGDPQRMDWFVADAAGAVSNLTATGSAVPPYPSGLLAPVQSLAAGNALFATETAAGGLLAMRQIGLDRETANATYRDLTGDVQAGSALSGPADLVVPGQGGHRLHLGATGALLGSTSPGLLLTPPSRGPQFSATWLHVAAGWGMAVFFLPDGTLFPGPLESGVTQLVMTAGNGCFVNGAPQRYLAPGVYQVLNLPPAAVRICISGAGG